MKVFQVRISDELHAELGRTAQERERTNASIIREALDSRVQSEPFAKAGWRLLVEDTRTGERTELIIPGLTKKRS